MDSAEVIAAAAQIQQTKQLAESFQSHVSRFTEEEQRKFQEAIAQLTATQLKGIQQVVSTSVHEAKSMRQILDLIASYLTPTQTPVFSLAESPFVTGHFLLETFGTFYPTQTEFLRWQQKQYAFERLKSVGVELVRCLFGGAK